MEEQADLVSNYAKFLEVLNEPTLTLIKERVAPMRRVYPCSDSSKYKAAGVVLYEEGDSRVTKIKTWTRKQVETHSINWKETSIAVDTIRQVVNNWRITSPASRGRVPRSSSVRTTAPRCQH